MERETNPMQPMCRSGCGFYGNPATDGLCSVCYKDSLRKKQTPPVNTASVSVSSPQQTSQTFSPAITVTNTAQPTVQSLQINETKDKRNFSRLENMSDSGQNKKLSSDRLNHNSKNKKLKLNSSSQNQLYVHNSDENSGNITTATDGEANVAKITVSDESSKQQQTQINMLPVITSNIDLQLQQEITMVTSNSNTDALNTVIENELLSIQTISNVDDNKLITTKKMSIQSIRLPNKRKFPSEDSSNTSINTSDNASGSDGPSTILGDDQEDKDGDKDNKKKKNRCAVCRKKVGLTGFECRCGGLFCAVHRYSDKHDCTFDYREHGAQEIRRNNPVVVGEKIQKI